MVRVFEDSLAQGMAGVRHGARTVAASAAGRKPGLYYMPLLHVDEIGLTSDKYMELNDTVESLPLQQSFSPNYPARHRKMVH